MCKFNNITMLKIKADQNTGDIIQSLLVGKFYSVK